MPLGSFLLLMALLVVVAVFVARPLVEPEPRAGDAGGEVSHWLAERERALDALAELDADWRMGKVPEGIYEEQRQLLLSEGVEALEHLDTLIKRNAAKRGPRVDEVEALIASHKKG